jgi:hypothetical protein
MLLVIIRWIATAAALWNGAFLAYAGAWALSRMTPADSSIDRVLLAAACFQPIVAALWSIPRPRQGSLFLFSAIATYVVFCAVRTYEEATKGETPGWDMGPFYMFVVPSAAIAGILIATTRYARPDRRRPTQS